ncbi:MAG: 30S ribosome-binding factor RbfA [Propionibacteriaceae bacterium]
MGNPRNLKLADQIKVIVAQLLERRVKDPRLGFVTITDVRLTGDGRECTLFYTVFGSAEEAASTAAALTSATGMLRTQVGKQLGLKFTPTLAFIADAMPESAAAMEDVLRRAKESDEAVAAVSAGKTYAGDADPYRRSEDLEDDIDDEDQV